MWFGDLHEVINSGKKAKDVDWTAFYYGAIVGVVPWIMMIIEFQRIMSSGIAELIPWWVWLFVAEYFCLFFVFPYTMLAQYKQWG
jgi:hypothetical protein